MRFLLLFPLCLFAMNGFDQIGVGTKSKGMGGVGVAFAQSALAAAHNPAGMALIPSRVDVGVNWLQLQSQNAFFQESGVNVIFCRDMSLGFSTYLKGLIDVRDQFQFYDYRFTPSWAWAITECHAIGIALNIVYAHSRLGKFSGDAVGGSIRVGWIGHFLHIFSLGFAIESQTWMSGDKNFFLRPIGGNSYKHPLSVTAGTSFCLSSKLLFAFDFSYLFWNASEGFGGRAISLRTDRGRGFGWDDQYILKFGLAYQMLHCLTLRIGYNYGSDPVPRFARSINRLTLARLRHHVTTGATLCLGRAEFSLAYIHGFKAPLGAVQNQVSASLGVTF